MTVPTILDVLNGTGFSVDLVGNCPILRRHGRRTEVNPQLLEVLSKKREEIIDYLNAYRWLTSFSMKDRVKKRCIPPMTCEFLVDFLDEKKHREYQKRRDLRWLDWNLVFNQLYRY